MNRYGFVLWVMMIALAMWTCSARGRWRSAQRTSATASVSGLVIKVEEAGWPSLTMDGAVRRERDYLRPASFVLGTISSAQEGKPDKQSSSGVATTMTFAGGNGTLRLTISRLSPAVLVDTQATSLAFFGSPGLPPAHWATPSSEGKVSCGSFSVSSLPVEQLDSTWLLTWYGRDSSYEATKWPFIDWKVKSSGPRYPYWPLEDSVFKADFPMLMLFEKAPSTVTVDRRRGLVFGFSGPAGKVVLMPIFGSAAQYADDTEKWVRSLPDDVAKRCNAWAGRLGAFPLNVTETVAYDGAADRVTHTEAFEFVPVRLGAKRYAPVPAMAALAKLMGAPIEFSGPLHLEPLLATPFGPAGAVAAEQYSWSVSGLTEYIGKPPPLGPSNAKSAPLEKELAYEVDRLTEAGHLAPLFYTFVSVDENVLAVQGTRYWTDLSEQLYLLAELLDVLPPAQRKKLLAYVEKERYEHPPEKVLRLDSAEGTRRERFTVRRDSTWVRANDRLSHKNDEFRAESKPSLYRAYGLSRFYQATGVKPDKEVLAFARRALAESMQARQWDTLAWVRGKYSYTSTLLRNSEQLHLTPRCANRDLAGVMGYLRLCSLAKQEGEAEAWGHFARLAILRFALGKYAHYQAIAGLVTLPRNATAAERLLKINDFTKPVNFFHQVRDVTPDGVRLTNGAVPPEPVTFGSYLMIYRDLVPEAGQLLADWGLGPETKVYLDHYAARNGTWFVLFSDAVDGRETPWLFLADIHQLFVAHAWIAKTDADTLAGFIDIPYAKLGDLFYMHKLAEAIKGYRQTKPGR